jgi:murein DD-endopeptidase MepM/ murein hydrolase activator NlpD
MATRNGWDPSHIAAIFSYETGGTMNPSEPGRGAAAGRVGLIQAGPNERLAYGLGTGNWAQEIKGVERYLKARGAKPGMGIADLYSTINGGNARAGYTPDGNGIVPRNASTLRDLERHRQQAMATLGLQQSSSYGLPVNAGLQQFARAKPVTQGLISSQFGNHESFRRHAHEGADVGLTAGSRLGFKVGGTILDVARTNSRDGEANGGYGNFMDVRLDNGQVVRMAHLKEIPAGLNKGSKFGASQIIARSGGRKGDVGAGRSTGDHLHFEEHSIRQGLAETTRGKLNPNRPGGSLSYLMWE